MRKLYERYFKISDDKKISEIVFKTRIISFVIMMLGCATLMVSSALALFTHEINGYSCLEAAVWDIYVEDSNGDIVTYSYVCEIAEDDIHNFTIFPDGSKDASGYCIITVEDPEGNIKIYNTEKFRKKLKIEIQAQVGCVIRFRPHWGKPGDFGAVQMSEKTIYHSVTPEEKTEESEAETTEESDAKEETEKTEKDTNTILSGLLSGISSVKKAEDASSNEEIEVNNSSSDNETDDTGISSNNVTDKNQDSTSDDSVSDAESSLLNNSENNDNTILSNSGENGGSEASDVSTNGAESESSGNVINSVGESVAGTSSESETPSANSANATGSDSSVSSVTLSDTSSSVNTSSGADATTNNLVSNGDSSQSAVSIINGE